MDAKEQDIWVCPNCGKELDISGIGFYSEITCLYCSEKFIVHDKLANFELDGVVGIGGMSVVLHAQDRVLNRSIAIKVLNDTYRNQPERIARFERECAMMAKVRHENVVNVYSAGWESGQFYIAMELVKGDDLETLVNSRGPLRQADALNYARQVALGLRAAQRAGLLHRDMKPGNVLLTEDGKAKVLDFGLALAQVDEDTEEVIWATPFYVAPETILREPEDLRTDIYSLGMTLRYLLTGEDAFSREPVTSISKLVAFKQTLPSLRQSNAFLEDSLCDLVDHMTEFNPDNRPVSYESLIREMDEVAAELGKGEALDTPEGKSRFRRRLLLGASATLGAGVLAAALTALLSGKPTEQRYVEVAEEVQWVDLKIGRESLAVLQRRGCSLEARDAFEKVAHESADPIMMAWASLHAAVLEDALEVENGMQQCLASFDRALARAEGNPCSGSVLDALFHAQRLLNGRGSKVGECQSINSPAIRGLVAYLESLRWGKEKKRDRQVEFLKLAEQSFAEAGEEYRSMREMCSMLVKSPDTKPFSHVRSDAGEKTALGSLAANAVPAAPESETPPGQSPAAEAEKEQTPPSDRRLTCAEQLTLLDKERTRCDVRAVAARAADLLKSHKELTVAQYDELRVVQEVADVLLAAFARVGEVCPNTLQPQDSLETIQQKVAQSFNPTFAKEVYAMLLLVKGGKDAALAANPYACDAASQEPFAVMMRDWLARLEH